MIWQWSDAWLLTSLQIGSGKGGMDLKGIIMIGDGINHAIFTLKELKGGLQKLISIKYVKVKDNRFLLTAKFQKDYTRIKRKPKDALELTDVVLELLEGRKLDNSRIVPLGGEVISKIRVLAAYQEYSKGFR